MGLYPDDNHVARLYCSDLFGHSKQKENCIKYVKSSNWSFSKNASDT